MEAFLVEDEFGENCSAQRTAPIVLDDNTAELDPALKPLETEKCILIQ